MSKSRLVELLAKKRSGEITLMEQQELAGLLKNNEAFTALARSMDAFSELDAGFNKPDHDYLDHLVDSLRKKLEQDAEPAAKGQRLLLKRLLAAAVFIGIIMTGALLLKGKKQSSELDEPNVFSTRRGSKSNLVLPDGTQVWLNADTKISYDKSFGNQSREVTLIGEAYFDVAHDASRPFIVHTVAMDVKVLGTAFNVRAYQDEKSTQAILLRGSVEVMLNNGPGKKVMLSPDEKIIVQHNRTELSKTEPRSDLPEITIMQIKKNAQDSGVVETQWTRNRLAFYHATLEEIALQLERWYDVGIQIEGKELQQRKFSGSFADEELPEIMEYLKLTSGVNFNYQINKKKVLIRP